MSKPSVSKSREALLEAFNELVINRPYNAISVGQIVNRADVGRSTFYEHFRDKHDLLRHSMEWIIQCLASTVDEDCDLAALALLLGHFQSVGEIALKFHTGSGGAHMATILSDALRQKADSRQDAQAEAGASAGLPAALRPRLIAETILAQIRTWLTSAITDAEAIDQQSSDSEHALACVIHQTARQIWSAPT